MMMTKPIPGDQAQRDRILTDLDQNLLVEAAAGTGKTTSMVGRMAALLEAGKCEVDSLAAVTFTRKAAAELRTRFQLTLERAVKKAEGQRKERLENALGSIDLAFIGTIHSFCARLLRERPVEAGVDPAFEELDEEADVRLRKSVWELFASQLYSSDPDKLLEELNHLGLTLSELRSSYFSFVNYPDVDEWPVPDRTDPPDLSEVRRQLLDYVAHMRKEVKNIPEDKDDVRRLMNEYRRIPNLIRYRDLDRPAELLQVLQEFTGKVPSVSKEKMKEYNKWATPERERWREMGKAATEVLTAWRTHRYVVSIKILERARDLYDQLRQERGLLNFQDLLMTAAQLLKRENVRKYFCRRFTHLLVDEFQDTDPVQAEVLLLLTADDEKQTDFRKCTPRPGSLFVVGDPKQSIYRFRRADIVTYNLVKSIIGEVVQLSTNFRCSGPIVDWVNRHFSNTFPDRATDQSPAYVALEEGRPEPHPGLPDGVYKLTVPADYCSKNEIAVDYEADRIARTIKSMLDQSTKVSPADFMIVTRYRPRLSTYAQALSRLGIPHRVTGGSALNEVPELALLYLVLNAVVQSDNPVALVAALRSEVFGVSDAALYDLKKDNGKFDYRSGSPDAFDGAFGKLRDYDLLIKKLPPVAAMERIACDLGLMSLSASGPAGPVQAGSLCKALEILRGMQAFIWSSAGLVDHLGVLVNRQERYDGISALSKEQPAVRLMNLHQVKGLEAPVIFLADPCGEGPHGVELHIDRAKGKIRGYLAILGEARTYHRPLLAHPGKWEDLSATEKKFLDAESERLRYVAATRAGSQLIITQREEGSRYNPWRYFSDSLTDILELTDPGPVSPAETKTEELTVEEVEDSLNQVKERLSSARNPTHQIHPAKDYAMQTGPSPSGLTLEHLDDVQDLPPEIPPEGEHGVEWGTVIHTLLEVAIKNPETDLEKSAQAALAEFDLDESHAPAAIATVQSVMKSEIWKRAKKSRACYPEIPFHLRHEEAPPTVLRGVIDLVFEEDQGWVIVDYKTDVVTDKNLSQLVKKYAPQVKLYSEAWQSATGKKVKETGLYFTSNGRYLTCRP
jgi:ATP-dependent helicase/nuclease subunit A